ncbi:MAG: enoyl-CoA hydratase/isomerase family protein [Rubrivivax sp.]
MNPTETLRVEFADGITTVTLDRPDAKNALSAQMAEELTATLDALRADESVRAVVLTGAGGDFCAGGDVKGMGSAGPRSPEQRRAAMARYRALTLALLGFDKPLVAALDGVAYGAGISIALAADLVLVSTRVRCALVFHRIGLVPDCGAWYTLPRIVGLQRAKELIYSAREFGADEALRLGLALEVLAPVALLSRAQALARSLGDGPALAFGLSKQALNASLQSELTTMLDLEAAAQALAGSSDYAADAVRRFAAREPARLQWPAASSSSQKP